MFVGTGKPRKPKLRAEARRLRREYGMPIRKIATRLGVSTSSVSYWVRGIEISAEHGRRNWEAHQGAAAQRKRVQVWSDRCRKKRLAAQSEGRAKAREGDPIHAAACMLYWAEGAKDKNQVCFANSDVRMVQTFVRFLRDTFAVPDDRITLRINVYLGNGLSLDDVQRYWLNATGLSPASLRTPTTNHYPTSSSGSRPNKLPYGVCTVRVNNTWIVQHIYGAIQEYAGFEEPRWLG